MFDFLKTHLPTQKNIPKFKSHILVNQINGNLSIKMESTSNKDKG
jgi:hypothetical protein